MRVSHQRFRPLSGSLLVACLAVTGCAFGRSGGEPTGSQDGPLSVAGGGGGRMALLPITGQSNRRAVFGGLDLCSSGAPVTIDQVRYRLAGGVGRARPSLRYVPHGPERAPRPGHINWAPLNSWRGSVHGPRAAHRIPGELSDRVVGAVVDEPCRTRARTSDLRLELLTSLTGAGDRGAFVRDLAVDYRADGEAFTVTVPWAMTLCGDEGKHPDC